MPAHPARGQPYFEAMKQAISASLGCIYLGPSSIMTQPYPYKDYDDTGNLTGESERQEQVVDGIEAIAASAAALLERMRFTAIPGMLNTPTGGPVTGSMPPGAGWIEGV